jgi:hypothetical protein
VELAPDQLDVRPIHRLLSGLPDGIAHADALAEHFEVTPVDGGDGHLVAAMEERGGLGLLSGEGRWLLVPTAATDAAAEHDLDTSRIDVARGSLPPHEIAFQAGLSAVRLALDGGRAQAAILVRPVTVEQIHSTGSRRERMPQKSTYFWPKPRTGMVFRTLD